MDQDALVHDVRLASYPREFLNRLGNDLNISAGEDGLTLGAKEKRMLEFFRRLPAFVGPNTSVATIIFDNRIRVNLVRYRKDSLRELCPLVTFDYLTNLGDKSQTIVENCLSLYGLRLGQSFERGRRRFLAFDELGYPELAVMPPSEEDFALTPWQRRQVDVLATRTGHSARDVLSSALTHFGNLVDLSETTQRMRAVPPKSIGSSIDTQP